MIIDEHLDILASVPLTCHELSCSVCSLKKNEAHLRNHYERAKALNKPSSHSDLISSVCPTRLATDSQPCLLWRSFFQLVPANNCSSPCVNTVYHSICQRLSQLPTRETRGQHLDKQRIMAECVCVCLCRLWCSCPPANESKQKSRPLWVTLHWFATSKCSYSLAHLCPLRHISPRDLIPFCRSHMCL